ncbi:MAG TPA: Xaa-Pro peptidase family protein [Actinomycetota bacterium]|nr:Xaa-Pro peptidase family protein [Actinomycetota bacterium]
MDYEGRIGRLREAIARSGADALLVTNMTNVRYLCGFSGSNGQMLVTQNAALFFTDPRYRARAGQLVQGADVIVYDTFLHESLAPALQAAGVTKVGIEGTTMTVAQRDQLTEKLGGVELAPTKSLVEELRRRKEAEEVSLLREAVRIGDEAFTWVLDRLGPGRTEREIALDLEVEMRRRGADSISFDPIVGSGPLSAHIHHSPSDRELAPGDLVLLDFGARWGGYCSDLTRTVVLGAASDHAKEVYATVLASQTAGIDAVGPGATGVAVDAAARAVIDDAGYGETFGHGLGHGVGLDIHEQPRLHKTSEDTLVPSDVVTVEPGVYETGIGGIRIEDCVLVTDEGSEVLGKAPKDTLIEIQ